MPIPRVESVKEDMIHAIRKARQIMAMLQGTMGLEGMGLTPQAYRRLKRKTINDLRNLAA